MGICKLLPKLWKGGEVGVTQMKGITCCGDCGYYNWKKHKCTRATDEGDARDNFYADCPLPDVVPVQEPRVMTWDEAKTSVTAGPFIIFEVRDSTGTELDFGVLVDDYYEMSEGSVLTVEDFGLMVDDYDKRFRIWTSRPTDEQREVTPWDG